MNTVSGNRTREAHLYRRKSGEHSTSTKAFVFSMAVESRVTPPRNMTAPEALEMLSRPHAEVPSSDVKPHHGQNISLRPHNKSRRQVKLLLYSIL